MKNKFKNYEELYNIGINYIYQYGRYVNWIKLSRDEKDNPIIINTNTNEIIKGLRNINKYLINHNLEVEY